MTVELQNHMSPDLKASATNNEQNVEMFCPTASERL